MRERKTFYTEPTIWAKTLRQWEQGYAQEMVSRLVSLDVSCMNLLKSFDWGDSEFFLDIAQVDLKWYNHFIHIMWGQLHYWILHIFVNSRPLFLVNVITKNCGKRCAHSTFLLLIILFHDSRVSCKSNLICIRVFF